MPGELTATEQRILEGLAEGLYDAEIAVRVGVTVGDLKQRVTAILQREHLADREALLAWYRGEERGATVRPLQANNEDGRRPWYIGGALAAGILALLAGFLVLAATGDTPPAAAEPTVAPEPTATAPPTGPPPPFVLGEPAPLDPGYAITVVALRYDADGRPLAVDGFDRIYLDPTDAGTVVREPIWRVPDGALFDANWTINNEGTRIAAVYVDADGQRWMEVQLDTGRFSDPLALERNEFPHLFAGTSVLMRAGGAGFEYLNPEHPESRQPLTLQPDGTDITPVGWSPDTGVLWARLDEGGLESGDLIPSRGTVPHLAAAFGGLVPGSFHDFVPVDGAREYLSIADYGVVSWRANQRLSQPPIEGLFVSIVRLATGEHVATYGGEFWPVGTASGGRVMGMYCEDECVLAIMDGVAPRLVPVEGLPVAAGEPLSVVATQPGPLARVRDLDGHCAPLMSGTVEPLREVVGCVTSGTLLTLAWPPGLEPGTPHIRGSGAAPFVHVLTLDGAAAWVEFDHVDVYLPVRD